MTDLSYGYTMLVVSNLDNSIKFYQKLFDKDPDMRAPRWSQFSVNKGLIGLHAENDWSNPNDPLKKFGVGQKGESIGLYTENMDKTLQYLKKKNIKVVDGPRMTGLGNTIYITDPDGYFIQICEPSRR